MVSGYYVQRLVDELVISLHTERNHIRNTREKLGASKQLEAVSSLTIGASNANTAPSGSYYKLTLEGENAFMN